jgi:membrane-associated phospholipid phosphatase
VHEHTAVGARYVRAPLTPSTYHYATLGLRRADAWKLGGFAATALLLATVDRRGDAWARHPGVQHDATLDALSTIGDKSGVWVAPAIGPALWLLGRARGDSGTAVLGLRTTEAVFVSGATVTVIKMLAGRTRPFASLDHSPTHWDLFGGVRSDSTRSFASGHSALASAAAVMLAAEWRRQGTRGWQTLGPPTVYTLATLTAASRVRDREHWMSDVVSGAAVGMLSALVVRRWHDAHPQSRIDRAFLRR